MKKRTGLNIVLAVVFALLVLLHWRLTLQPSRRGVDFFPEMMRSIPAEAYASNPVLADGMTLQTPPEGTIPRGLPPLPFAATPEDAVRAGEELVNPFSGEDAAAVDRGQDVYSRYCLLCHGPAGEGNGMVATRGFPAPPSLLAPHARSLKDGQIFHIMTFGQGNMPDHAAQLDRRDRWKALLWVRQLQAAAPSTEEPAEPATTVAGGAP